MTVPVADPDSPDLERRFGGLARLYGAAGAQRIRQAHVVVVGVGGVGSWAAEALARSGVGRLSLIDLDHVSESNINRQIQALTATVGQAKVLALQARIAQINPAAHVVGIEDFVDADNWLALLPADADAVIDACDQVRAKVAMAAWARGEGGRGKVFIAVGAAGGKQQAHKVDIADLAEVTHDPLLANVRSRLRKAHGAPREGRKIGVEAVFSRESVAAPQAPEGEACEAPAGDGSLNCHGYGSTVAVTATFGQCAAGRVLEHLARRPG